MLNEQTKLVFALEHIAHLGDLIQGNEYEQYLEGHVSSLKYEMQRQLRLVEDTKGIRT